VLGPSLDEVLKNHSVLGILVKKMSQYCFEVLLGKPWEMFCHQTGSTSTKHIRHPRAGIIIAIGIRPTTLVSVLAMDSQLLFHFFN
jgi:hypothetical protein